MKHLSVNWKVVSPGPRMWQLFWLACGAFSEYTFKKAMEQIQKHKAGARVWLANLGEQERWTKHKFDPNFKCDVNKTNFVESFNVILGVERSIIVLTLLEGVRRMTMARLVTRIETCEGWDRQDICPNIIKRVQQLWCDSRMCRVYPGQGEFEIIDGKSTLVVSLNNRTWLCNAWQLTSIPCKHGMRAILYYGKDPLQDVHEWCSIKRYKMAYSHGISLVPDRDQWSETNLPTIEPSVMKRRLGRPVKNRKRGEEEARKGKRSAIIKCSRCGEFGHNKLTCQGRPTKKQKLAQSKTKDVAGSSKSAKQKGKATTSTVKKKK